MPTDIIKIYQSDKFELEGMSFVGLIDQSVGVTITLVRDADEREVEIIFENPIAYRCIDTNFLDRLWGYMDEEKVGYTLYTVEKSSFLDYITEMSFGIYDRWVIQHFAIYTEQFSIDVLTTGKPDVVWK